MIYVKNSFSGGIAEGSKQGYQGSFQDGVGLDYRSDADKLQTNLKLKKDSSNIVVGLCKIGIEYKGLYYFYDDAGNIYQRDTGGTYRLVKAVSSSAGQGMVISNDILYYANQNGIGKATNLTNASPTFTDDILKSISQELTQASDATSWATSNTYTVKNSLSETSTDKRAFITASILVTGITFRLVSKGTGNITVTLHDNSNNQIASVTIANASLVNGLVRFSFGGAFAVNGTYHFHVFSSVNDATIACTTSSDLSTMVIGFLRYYGDTDTDQSNDLRTLTNIGTNSYTLPTIITETATNLCSFTPLISSLQAISVYTILMGTGTWTLTVHDALQTVVATASILTGSMIERGGLMKFDFGTPVSVIPGATYHFHLTISTGTSTVLTTTNSDLSTVGFKTHFPVLNTDANYHDMVVYGNKVCIGNGRFVATLDDSGVYVPEAVPLPQGESVLQLESIGDFLATSTWRGATLSGYSKSRIYLWDGVSPFVQAFLDIDGQVNAMKNDGNNFLYILHGTQGEISVYNGAITKLRRLKYVNSGISTFFYPHAIDNLEGIIYFGNNTTSDSSVASMIYSYGRKDRDYPSTLNKDFVISTGNSGTTVQIGCILGISASKFFVSWKDTTSGTVYGVDIIDTTNQQTGASITTLRFDNGDSARQKLAKAMSVRFGQIIAGQKITVQYRRNNTGNFITLFTVDPTNNSADTNMVYKSFAFDASTGADGRFFEIEFKILLDTTISASPTFIGLAMDFDTVPTFQLDEQ